MFWTAPSINTYRAFVADFDSTMLCCSTNTHHVHHSTVAHVVPEDNTDFIADKNIKLPTNLPIVEYEGDIASDDETVLTSNAHRHNALAISSPSST
jgi:uncharacterized alpha/beta hydrolase family protein